MYVIIHDWSILYSAGPSNEAEIMIQLANLAIFACSYIARTFLNRVAKSSMPKQIFVLANYVTV